jgi:hypothetical protein
VEELQPQGNIQGEQRRAAAEHDRREVDRQDVDQPRGQEVEGLDEGVAVDIAVRAPRTARRMR